MVVLPADRYTRYTSRYTSINIQVGNSAAALEDFDAGIKAGYALAYIGAARVHLVAGNAAEALASLRLVDELRPTDSVVYTLRSEAYDAMGDVEAAAEQRTLAEMLTEGKECCVCMEAVRNTRLHPCMHSALCAACAEGMRARGSKCVARRPPQFVSSFVCPESPPAEAALFARCPICCLTFVHIENDVHGRFAVDTFTPTLCDGASGDHLRAAVMAAAQLTAGQVQTLLGDEIDAHAAEAVGTTQGVSAEERD